MTFAHRLRLVDVLFLLSLGVARVWAIRELRRRAREEANLFELAAPGPPLTLSRLRTDRRRFLLGLCLVELGEDAGGVLWVATTRGLARLDTRLVRGERVFESIPLPGPPEPFLRALRVEPGGIYAASRDTLYHVETNSRTSRVETFPLDVRRMIDLEAVIETPHGLVLATAAGLFLRRKDGSFLHLPIRPAHGGDEVHGLARDREGRLWISHGYGLLAVVLDPAWFESAPPGNLLERALPLAESGHVHLPTRPGEVRALANASGEGRHVGTSVRVSGDRVLATTRSQTIVLEGDGLFVNDLWNRLQGRDEDGNGDVWAGVFAARTLARWDRKTDRFQAYTLSIFTPTSFAEDARGTLWIGLYDSGVVRYENGRFDVFGLAEGCPPGFVHDLLLTHDGRLLLASSRGGLVEVQDQAGERPVFVPLATAPPLSSEKVYSVAEDDQGRLYVGGPKGVDVASLDGRSWKHLSYEASNPGTNVSQSLPDGHGCVLFASSGGISRYCAPREKPGRTSRCSSPPCDRVSAPSRRPRWAAGVSRSVRSAPHRSRSTSSSSRSTSAASTPRTGIGWPASRRTSRRRATNGPCTSRDFLRAATSSG